MQSRSMVSSERSDRRLTRCSWTCLLARQVCREQRQVSGWLDGRDWVNDVAVSLGAVTACRLAVAGDCWRMLAVSLGGMPARHTYVALLCGALSAAKLRAG